MTDICAPSPSSEKKDDSGNAASRDETPTQLEQGKDQGELLNEQEAIARARARPDSTDAIWVTFSIDDPHNPRNFPKWKKWYITCLVSFFNIVTSLCAGGYSSAAADIGKTFGVSSEVVNLGLSMFIIGFAIGPLMLAPLSEYYGRTPVYIGSWFLLCIFQLPLALAPNIGTILVCRLLAGTGGAAPLTNAGGTISDLWARNESGNAMMLYGLCSTAAQALSLTISGYIVQEMGFRWLFWVYMIVTGGTMVVTILVLPETRHSTILERKAKRVRKALAKEGLGNAPILSHISDAHNKGKKHSMHRLFAVNLTRPFKFLFTEPITIGAAAYNGVVYGILYLFNESFPLVFTNNHGFNTGEEGLSFLGVVVGAVIAASLHPTQERYYLKQVAKNNGKGVPEARMWQSMFGACLIPISLFWFAWTSYSSVPWIVPIIASSFFGAGVYIVVLGALNYVVDSYQTYSASALAGVVFGRNIIGCTFPLFARQMYDGLGYQWAGSLVAFLSLLFVPIPIWWFYRGEGLRLSSPWAREHFSQDEDSPH